MISNPIWEEAGARSSKGTICKKEHGSMGLDCVFAVQRISPRRLLYLEFSSAIEFQAGHFSLCDYGIIKVSSYYYYH